jgi:hypothetical protein
MKILFSTLAALLIAAQINDIWYLDTTAED